MVTVRASDHSDEAPLLSVALAVTWYVPARLQVCEAAPWPELNSPVSEVMPSPQLKVNLTGSPSGSTADVV